MPTVRRIAHGRGQGQSALNGGFEEWQDVFQTLVTSVYFTTVAFLPLLQAGIEPHGPLEKFEASVITTSSISGLMRDAQGHFAYNAAKGATVSKLPSLRFCDISIGRTTPVLCSQCDPAAGSIL